MARTFFENQTKITFFFQSKKVTSDCRYAIENLKSIFDNT